MDRDKIVSDATYWSDALVRENDRIRPIMDMLYRHPNHPLTIEERRRIREYMSDVRAIGTILRDDIVAAKAAPKKSFLHKLFRQ